MSYGGTYKYWRPAGKSVSDGDTAVEDDINLINEDLDVAFEEVANDLNEVATISAGDAENAREFATNPRGVEPMPVEYPGEYSSRANKDTARDWAEAPGEVTDEAGNLIAGSASAKAKAEEALISADAAEGFAEAAELSETAALDAEIMAEEWAEHPEDTEITGHPGQYSSLHHAAKADASRIDAETAEDNAELAQAAAEDARDEAVTIVEAIRLVDETIFVSTAGNDVTGDGSAGAPYATPFKAFSEYALRLYGPDNVCTIEFAAGSYSVAGLDIYGTTGQHLTLKGVGNVNFTGAVGTSMRVIGRANNIYLDNINFTGGVYLRVYGGAYLSAVTHIGFEAGLNLYEKSIFTLKNGARLRFYASAAAAGLRVRSGSEFIGDTGDTSLTLYNPAVTSIIVQEGAKVIIGSVSYPSGMTAENGIYVSEGSTLRMSLANSLTLTTPNNFIHMHSCSTAYIDCTARTISGTGRAAFIYLGCKVIFGGGTITAPCTPALNSGYDNHGNIVAT